MATGNPRPTWLESVDLDNSNVFVRLAVYRNTGSADVPDTSSTGTTLTLRQFIEIANSGGGGGGVESVNGKTGVVTLNAADVGASTLEIGTTADKAKAGNYSPPNAAGAVRGLVLAAAAVGNQGALTITGATAEEVATSATNQLAALVNKVNALLAALRTSGALLP